MSLSCSCSSRGVGVGVRVGAGSRLPTMLMQYENLIAVPFCSKAVLDKRPSPMVVARPQPTMQANGFGPFGLRVW